MIFDTLRNVTAQILGVDPNEIRMDMTFLSDLGADSLDVCQIVTGVEQELNISIPVDELKTIKTVKEAVDLISRCCEKISE